MSFISLLQNCGCLSASTMRPREPVIVEQTSYSTTLHEIGLVAARVFSAIAAGTTALIFLASGSLIAGAFAIGLTCLTVCLWPSTDTPTVRVARPHLYTNPILTAPMYTPPPVYRHPPEDMHRQLWNRSPDFFDAHTPVHFPSFNNERVRVGDHTSSFIRTTSPTFAEISPHTMEDRIQVGDHARIEEAQNERVQIRRR